MMGEQNKRRFLVVLVLLILVTGCATPEHDQGQVEEAATAVVIANPPSSTPIFTPPPTPTATVTATAVPTSTLKPTATETPIPTPTPTTVPMHVTGNPRAVALQAPVAQEGAPCGLVDLFDFPLDAPHGRDARGGGSDFGIWRDRFDGYHAGEDWWIGGGRGSLGKSVYSIGHGEVTYAEPLGWNRDKGVIIIRHTFPGGRSLLSFYGHLDEDSLKVEAGDCVRRGEMIGKIGRPTTSPHLHFEIRTYMPFAPGRGYMPDDPTLAGWVPPSETIWNRRIEVSPGVLWTQSAATGGVRSAEPLGEEMIILLGGDHIIAIDTASGDERWRTPVNENVERLLVDGESRQIVTANQLGEVSAFALPDNDSSAVVDGASPLWTADLDVVGIPALMPLPGGGLVLSAWYHLIALSAAGEPLWEVELETWPYDWLVSGDTLIVSTNGGERPLLTADANGWQRWDTDVGGRLVAAGDNVLLYDGDGIHRLDLEAQSTAPLFALPGGRLGMGDVAALPGGGAILAHVDRADRRLIALDGAGNILWDRSIAESTTGELSLFSDGSALFLVDQNDAGSGNELSLFSIDLEEATLTHLFTGGSRSSPVDRSSLSALGNSRVLINIDGRVLTLLDTNEAQNHGPFRPID